MAIAPQYSSITFQQARARIAHMALRTLSREQIAERMLKLRVTIPPNGSTKSLAFKFAWALLPA